MTILLVKQDAAGREWSLPGGRVEAGELLEQSVIRELFEETALVVKVDKLLYVCDKPDSVPPILHITLLVSKLSGDITLPTNQLDSNPISDVQFVPVSDLERYGFSKHFMELVGKGFPNSGNYMGLKTNIGL